MIFYEWYVLSRNRAGQETRKKLRWRMSQEDAMKWAAANPGKPLEMVPNSGEDRCESTGPYLGWGLPEPKDKAVLGIVWPPAPKE